VSTPDDSRRYRIAAVAELTDVPEATLRAWERRYGVPTPERTATGYRLYTSAAVDEVQTMRGLCDDGMAASEAAKLVLSRRGGAKPAVAALARDAYKASVEALVDACVRFDVDELEQVVRRLPLLGDAITLVDRVVTPALWAIGQKWHEGELSVAQERMASQRLSTFLRDLLRLTSGASSRRVVLACFADEDHELGLLGTAIRLATWGIQPVYLGGRMPPGALGNAIASVKPILVGLSLTIAPDRPRARELAENYGAACADVPWVVGGRGAGPVKEVIEMFGGRVLSDDASELRGLVHELLRDGGSRSRRKAGAK
jgi:DNA-binding transcriptional MerR regulator